MDVDLTVGQGGRGGGQGPKRPRPHRFLRLLEGAGLLLLLYGIASDAWGLALLGAGAIVSSYAIYRWRYGVGPWGRKDAGRGDDVDSGGDSGGD